MASRPTQTPVDSYILTRLLKEIPPAELVLYLALYELTEGSGPRTIALGIQGLATLTGLSKSSIQRVVKGLKKKKLISVNLLKPTSTPEYEVRFPWRKQSPVSQTMRQAEKAPEKSSISKKNIVGRVPRKKEPRLVTGDLPEKPPEPSISKSNIDEKKTSEFTPPQKPMSLSEATAKWGKGNAFYLTLKRFKEQERHFKKNLSPEEQEAWLSAQKKRLGQTAGDGRDTFGVDVTYSRALEEWWRVEAPKRRLTLKTKLPSALDPAKRKRRSSGREAESIARALAIFREKEKGFKSSLSPQEQKRWIEEHLKKLGPETQTWGKNALGLDIGYQLAVEAWWKATGNDLP